MGRRKQGYITKQSPEFIDFILGNFKVDNDKGDIITDIYCSAYVNIGFKGNTVSIPISHLVWLIIHKRWPQDGSHIDHIDDDPLNNRPSNLREVTQKENQAKKKGRKK